jgi:hypothetical protein
MVKRLREGFIHTFLKKSLIFLRSTYKGRDRGNDDFPIEPEDLNITKNSCALGNQVEKISEFMVRYDPFFQRPFRIENYPGMGPQLREIR